MSSVIEELIAKFGADTGDFDKGIRSVESAISNFAGLAGGISVAGIFVTAVKQAAESEDAIAGLNNVIKSTKGVAGVTSESAIDLANSLQKVSRFSDENILSAETMLLRYNKIGKDIFPQVTEQALDLATALGIDATSAAKMLGKAYQDPADGATALTKAGVKLTDAQVREIQSLQRSGQFLKAQKKLYEDVAVASGGAARAAGQTFSGSLDILKNSISDLFEAIGGALLPILTPLVQGFSSAAQSIAPLVAQFAPLIVGIGAVVLALSPLGAAVIAIAAPIAGIVAAVALLKSAWDNDFLGMRTTISELFTAIKPDIDNIIAAVQGMIAILQDPMGGISKRTVMAEVKLARAGGEDTSGLTQGFDIGDRIAMAIREAGPKVRAAIKSAVGDIGTWFNEDAGKTDTSMGAGSLFRGFVANLNREAASSAPQDNPVKFAIRNWMEGLVMDKETGQNLWNFIPEPDLGAKISSAATNAITAIQSSQPVKDLANALDAILNTKFDLVGGLSASINDVLTWVLTGEGSKALGAVSGAIVGALTAKLADIGGAIKTAFAQGLLEIAKILEKLSGMPFVGPTASMLHGALVAAVGGRAFGGPVAGGTPYLVGERGPELFVPGQSGAIVPNNQLGGGGGSMTINITLVANGVNDPDALLDKVESAARRRNWNSLKPSGVTR